MNICLGLGIGLLLGQKIPAGVSSLLQNPPVAWLILGLGIMFAGVLSRCRGGLVAVVGATAILMIYLALNRRWRRSCL